jgi:peptidyl-prolyl cis-trans isomerase SurA
MPAQSISACLSRRGARAAARGLALAGLLACGAAPALAADGASRPADHIVAVVNQELVTHAEVEQRLAVARAEAARSGVRVPAEDALRRRIVEGLIDERAQLTHARDSGLKVDDPELDRAVSNVALQNRLSLPQLRERLQQAGIDFQRFRANLRDQLLLERVREREVQSRIKVSDSEIDAMLAGRSSGVAPPDFNVAQLLVSVPEGADDAVVAERRAIAERALARAKGGEDFGRLVAELSDGTKDNGGSLGLRTADRLPDLFVQAVGPLRSGEVAPQLVKSGAGFHVLKLLERREGGLVVTQTRARHILLRTSEQLPQPAAIARLAEMKLQIAAGQANFAQLARENSEDGSAAQGGDLGWASPGQFVPEFDEAMKNLEPEQISDPVVSRFGVHLIQVVERRQQPVDRKQQREIARNVLRERKFDTAYQEWAREVRARAYVERREAPQ